MAKTALSPAEFIATRGGPHKVARVLKVEPGTVRMWSQRNTLPRTRWPEILDAFPDMTLDELRAIEAAKEKAA
jgi:hypothetical protein